MIGGGDSAMEEALFLTKFAKSVTVVHRRDSLRASKIMADRALAHEKINFVWNTGVEDVLGQDKVTGLRLKNLVDGTETELAVTGVFVAIGNDPRTELVKDKLDLTPREPSPSRAAPRRPASRASSPPATSSTPPTARPSRPRVPAVWPPSTSSTTLQTFTPKSARSNQPKRETGL